uniref:E3 ubiquitin-protein ligase n=1 Tax=Anopheles stephensi TaxID=30069 RepID=A0A182Y9D8_ANOST
MENFRCAQCKCFPNGDVWNCTAKEHFYCAPCKESKGITLCACGAQLQEEQVSNPIEKLLYQAMCPCRYAPNGCTWKFVKSEMEAHVLECRFRPYRCVAHTLNVLKCDWEGVQHQIENHLTEGHKELGPMFRFRQSTSLVFKEQISLGGLKVVDAFSKRFLFHFFSDVANRKLSFLMIYFGRREEANQYCYELELRAAPIPSSDAAEPAEKEKATFARSVKFVERCCSDSEDLAALLQQDRCITLAHRQVLNYLHEGKLHMAYKVRKVDAVGREKKLSTSSVPGAEAASVSSTASTKPKPRPPPFVFANKEKVASNSKRSSSASSSASSKSTSSSESVSSSSASQSTTKASPSPSSLPSRTPSSASTATVCSERNSVDALASAVNRSSLSSINRVTTPLTPFEKPEQCPLLTPSINKHDVPPTWVISQTTTSGFAYHTSTEYHRQMYGHEPYRSLHRYPPGECTTTAAVCQKYTQPYKEKDDRPYLMKHPTNCLYKPQPKWSAGGGGKGGG